MTCATKVNPLDPTSVYQEGRRGQILGTVPPRFMTLARRAPSLLLYTSKRRIVSTAWSLNQFDAIAIDDFPIWLKYFE